MTLPNTAHQWEEQARQCLDRAETVWSEAGPERALRYLAEGLLALRRDASTDWRSVVVPIVRDHPMSHRIRQSSTIAAHASTWPRGYPGDAGMIDEFYEAGDDSRGMGEEQRRANAYIRQSSPGQSVRYRRMVLAEAINQCAVENRRPAVLSVACGHVREVEWSHAMANGLVHRFVAADQDPRSLETVRERLSPRYPAVEPTHLSVRGILSGRGTDLGHFHLIYAAGLYDYLSGPLAAELTAHLFRQLHPGGRLLVGNFSDTVAETGFMESVLNWPLNWRSAAEVAAFASAIPTDQIRSDRVWPDPTGNCLYIDLTKI